MPEIRRILLPTDFSPRAETAKAYALKLAGAFGAELHLLHVLQEPILNSLGYSLLAEKKTAEAVRMLELAAAWYPESANAHDSLGDAYEAAGRTAEAIRESERALALLDKAHPQRREGIRQSAEEKLKRLKQ